MAAGIYNLKIEKGTCPDIVINYKDSTGVPVNLTGWSAHMQVRFTQDSTDVMLDLSSALTTLVLNSSGDISFNFPGSLTSAVVGDSGVYDLELTPPNGKTIRLLKGTVTFDPEVTRE